MRAYLIVNITDEYNWVGLIGKPRVYLSMKKAREDACEFLTECYHEPFSSQFSIDCNGVETTRYVDREDNEICRIIEVEVK